jgi:hypothetical protein
VDRRLRPCREPAARRYGGRLAGPCICDPVTVSAPSRHPLQVNESEEMRAFGFSPNGATFVIATSPGIAIYRRHDEEQ